MGQRVPESYLPDFRLGKGNADEAQIDKTVLVEVGRYCGLGLGNVLGVTVFSPAFFPIIGRGQ
jgi:hypothetical protein